jgi:DNA-binding PadR family transcriptional regulator
MRSKPVPNLAESKLILLYLASRMPSGIEHDEIVRFNAEGGWMLYFEMEQYLKELAEDALLQESDGGGGRKLYAATADGLNVLGLLKTSIPLPVRSAIDAELAERRSGMEMEQEVTADYTQDSATEYPVMLRILENRLTLFEMNLTAPSAEAASEVCARFREQAAEIYASLIERLTRDEPAP